MDSNYGSALEPLLEIGPVWIVQSPANDPVAAKIWQRGGADLTTFKPQTFEDILTVDEHHSDWDRIDVYGQTFTESVRAAALELGALAPTTVAGFSLTRRKA
jgi:hypothetical protein